MYECLFHSQITNVSQVYIRVYLHINRPVQAESGDIGIFHSIAGEMTFFDFGKLLPKVEIDVASMYSNFSKPYIYAKLYILLFFSDLNNHHNATLYPFPCTEI